MSFKTLPKSLIDSVSKTIDMDNTAHEIFERNLFAQGLRKFGVKKASQLSEVEYKSLHAWVQTKLMEAQCHCDVVANDIDEEELTAQDVVTSELEKMGKSLGELTPNEKKDLFNKVDKLVKAKNEQKTCEKMHEGIAIAPQDVATNNAVAVGSAMTAQPIHADVIRNTSDSNGVVEYRLLLQYATGRKTFSEAPYEGTHIYPPTSMPGATSIEMLRDIIENMPFYTKVVERAINNALDLPSKNPMFVGNDKKISESRKIKKKIKESVDYPTSLAKNEQEASPSKLPKIYLDMDETIVAWEIGANKALEDAGKPEWNDPYWKETYGEHADTEKWKILNATSDFWEKLKFTNDGRRIWNFVRQYRPNILSACGNLAKTCKSGKMNWIKSNLNPQSLDRIHLVARSDKKKFALDSKGNPNILIDDYAKNCQEFRAAGGIAVQVTTADEVISKLRKLGFK